MLNLRRILTAPLGLQPVGGRHVLHLALLQLLDARLDVLNPVPRHLEHLGRGVAASLVRLPGRNLRQVVDLLRQLRLDDVERFQELVRVRFRRLLAGFLFAQFE